MFPLEIIYKKQLNEKFESCSSEMIINAFEIDFKESGVSKLRSENDGKKLIAEIELFAIRPGWNWNRWNGIGKSSIEIVETIKNDREVIYKFNLTRMLVGALIISLFVGIISTLYWIGLLVFGVLGILNWIIKLIQHHSTFNSVFDNIIYEMNKPN